MVAEGCAVLSVQTGKRMGLVGGSGPFQSCRVWARRFKRREGRNALLLWDPLVWMCRLERLQDQLGPGSHRAMVVPVPHADPRKKKPEVVECDSLRLQRADKDGVGFLGTVLGFSLFGKR